MTDPSLIEKLEKATEGNLWLDAAIGLAVGHYVIGKDNASIWNKTERRMLLCLTDGKVFDDLDAAIEALRGCLSVPRYTSSLDAALTLVPEGWRFTLSTDDHGGFPERAAHAVVMSKLWADPQAGDGQVFEGHAATPALALCPAALRAREQQEKAK